MGTKAKALYAIKAICNPEIIEDNLKLFSWEVKEIVADKLGLDADSIEHDILESLYSIPRYNPENREGKPYRLITTERIEPPVRPNPRGYNILYHF